MEHLDQNKLDLFLKDELSSMEKEKFIQEMENNPSLKEEVQTQQELVKHLNNLGDLELKSTVKDVHQKAIAQKKSNSRPLLKIILVILGFSLLALAYFLMNQTPKNEKLYQAYYQSYDKLSFTSRSSNTLDEQINIAGDFYQQKNYQQALPLFKDVRAKNPSDTKTCMAVGICEMELQQFQSALKTFDRLIQKNDRLYYYQAVWYSALIHLQKGNSKESISNLNILVNQPDAIFHKEAKKLLAEIE